MGGVLFALTQNLLSVISMAMMPLFIVGHYVDHKMQGKRQAKEGHKQFNAAMLAFQLGDARETGPHAEQFRVAAVDAGHQGVRQHPGRLPARPPPRKLGDRLIAVLLER